MSQEAHGSPPSKNEEDDDDSEDKRDSQPDRQRTPSRSKSKSKSQRTSPDRQRATSKHRRRSVAHDAVPEDDEVIRRPKSSMRTKFGPSASQAALPRVSHQLSSAAPLDPNSIHPDFLLPRYPASSNVPPRGYGFPPPPAMPQANQARPFIHPPRLYPPNPVSHAWAPQYWSQPNWNAFGQQAPPARPYVPPLPAFPQPLRRALPSPLERENNQLKRELEIIKIEQQRQKKEKEKLEKAKAKAARKAAEREAVRKKAFEELRPVMDQYVNMLWREKNLAAQDMTPRICSGYDMRDMPPLQRGMPHQLQLEQESGLNPAMEEFSQFLERKRIAEGQWPYNQPTNSGSLLGSSAQEVDLAAKSFYNPMTDQIFQNQVADMMPRILQQMQQSSKPGDWLPNRGLPSHSRNIAAEAAELNQQIFGSWNDQQPEKRKPSDRPTRSRTPKPRKPSVDSRRPSVGHADGPNTGRARKPKGRKKSFSSHKHDDYPDEQIYPGDFREPDEDVDFEMIPGRRPTPYGYEGVFAPEPPVSWRNG
jgi:hypothetical protein